MPRYYFHLYNHDVTRDEEGQELADIDAARTEAVRSARDLICDSVRAGKVTLGDRIEIVDDRDQPVLTVTFADVVQFDP